MKKEEILNKPVKKVCYGYSTINHKKRIEFGLNCSEYCLLDFYSKSDNKIHQIDYKDIFNSIGFNETESNTLFCTLKAKGFIDIKNNEKSFIFTLRWLQQEHESERLFNKFWTIGNEKGKVAWSGSKPEAFRLFKEACKVVEDPFYLINQRDHYFEFLKLQKDLRNFDQAKMMATVFLNIQKKRFEENWYDQCQDLIEKYGTKKKKEKVDPKNAFE